MMFIRFRRCRQKALITVTLIVCCLIYLGIQYQNNNLRLIPQMKSLMDESQSYVTDLCLILDKRTLAVILVNSAARNEERRHQIRTTWGNKYLCRSLNVVVVFVVGETADPVVAASLEIERRQYSDILKLPVVDSYHHLVEKLMGGIKWILHRCTGAQFVIKVDDDIFINIFALESYLYEHTGVSGKFLCLVWPSIKVQRNPNSRWYISKDDYPHPTYPPYCSGSAYIMPYHVAKTICDIYLNVPLFWVEDVYITGMLAQNGMLGHVQIGHYYGFVDYKYQDVIEGKIIFAHIRHNETQIKNKLWNKIVKYEKMMNNSLLVIPESYTINPEEGVIPESFTVNLNYEYDGVY